MDDYHLDESEAEHKAWHGKKLSEFQRNGASYIDALSLLVEMEADPFFQEGLDYFQDSTISRRVALYSD